MLEIRFFVKNTEAGTDVVNAKSGKGSATLSMAYAGWNQGKVRLVLAISVFVGFPRFVHV